MEIVFSIRTLRKTYRMGDVDVHALQDIDLDPSQDMALRIVSSGIPLDEWLGVPPAGSRPTTLCQVICTPSLALLPVSAASMQAARAALGGTAPTARASFGVCHMLDAIVRLHGAQEDEPFHVLEEVA